MVTCQSRHDSTSSQEQLATNQNVGEQSKEDEDPVRHGTVTRIDDFEIRVTVRGVLLNFASQYRKHQDLHRGASGVLRVVSLYQHEASKD